MISHKMIEPSFTQAEVNNIINTKSFIKLQLSNFELTIQKLGIRAEFDYYVSGGCIASCLQGYLPNDFDVYFRTEKTAEHVIDLYKTDAYKNEIAVMVDKYRDVEANIDDSKFMITENAMTLKNKIQVIIKHYGNPDDVRKTFDYVHCLPYYTPTNDKLFISREQYDCCVKMLLKNNRTDVAPSMWREQKFLKRGYKIYGTE